MASLNVSIIIPAHNEERRLLATLRRYAGAFEQRFGENFDRIVVANGCTDHTALIGAKAFTRHAARVLSYDVSETGWVSDVDLLLTARGLGLSVQEHPVIWIDSFGSRMRFWATLGPVCSSLWRLSWRSAADLGSLRTNAILEKRAS